MAELPESLKKYLPGPLGLILTFTWIFAGEPITEFVRDQFRHEAARVRVEDKRDNLHLVHIEVTRYAAKDFENVTVEIQLESKPDDIKGELAARDGTRSALLLTTKNTASTDYYTAQLAGKSGPINLHPREALEFSLHESASRAVQKVWLDAKEHPSIATSDFNQRWPIAESSWRLVLALLATFTAIFLYKLFAPLVFRKTQKQLKDDQQFLRECWNGDAAALARFQAELQLLIDAATAKYLKAFNPVTRDRLRQSVIPIEIAKRADNLPRFRHALAGQVQKFVIQFCVDMLEEEFKQINKEARRELATIR
jgi:hypothetical protein